MEISLPDGRRLAYQVLGGPDGLPVLLLHGTPGSSRQLASLGGQARERGLAMIAPDRAGYGRSEFDPRRTIASGARDVGELIARLALPPCAVVGLSGGGPPALACGAILPGQVPANATPWAAWARSSRVTRRCRQARDGGPERARGARARHRRQVPGG